MKTLLRAALILVASIAFGAIEAEPQGETSKLSPFAIAVSDSMFRAVALFPDADKDGTKLHAAVVLAAKHRGDAKDPMLMSPDWPELLVSFEAAKLGIAPVKAK